MEFCCIGLSHENAGVSTRERYAFGPREHEEGLRQITATPGVEEAVILSTCNRVEIYATGPERTLLQESSLRFLQEYGESQARRKGFSMAEEATSFYQFSFPHSVEHLFSVASGLQSMMIGETEIFGQVKKAYSESLTHGASGSFTNRIFQRAFRVGKYVRTHTGITRGAVSIGTAAVELAGQIFGNLKGRQAMILGAGEIGEQTARNLVSRGVESLIVSNRSYDRAEKIAAELNGRAERFDHWPDYLTETDIVIASTAAPHTIMHAAEVREAMRRRRQRPLFIIDVAVPRDVSEEVNGIDNVYLYDIDALQSIADQAAEERRGEIAKARTIIRQHVQDVTCWVGYERGKRCVRGQLRDFGLREDFSPAHDRNSTARETTFAAG